MVGWLIQRTSSPSTPVYLLATRQRSCLWNGQVSNLLQCLTWLLITLGQCLLPSTCLPLHCGWWNETTLGSLSEALLDGHVGEGTRELLDDTHVYLRAEGDVQEEKLWTRLEEFLQWGRTHQTSTCQLHNRQIIWGCVGRQIGIFSIFPEILKCALGILLPQDMSTVKWWFTYFHVKIKDIGKICALIVYGQSVSDINEAK